MSLYTIGDLHLSMQCDKPMDIFKGWQDYVERLCKNWREVISSQDSVIIPGDISWGMTLPEARADFELINSLPGTKYILKGNHDYWWNTMRKMESFFEDNGFDTIKVIHNNAYRIGDISVCGTRGWFFDAQSDADGKVIMREAGRLRASLEAAVSLGGEPVVFLHYPPVSSDNVCEQRCEVLLEYRIKRCFFGHLHGYIAPENAALERDGTQFRLVSADYLAFCPRLIEKS